MRNEIISGTYRVVNWQRSHLFSSLMVKTSHYPKKCSQFFSNSPKQTIARPILRLNIIDDMVKVALANGFPSLKNTAFIGIQHILDTTATLFEALVELGARPDNMYFTGKCYSTSLPVAQTIRDMGVHLLPDKPPVEIGTYKETGYHNLSAMWRQFLAELPTKHVDNIIILDDGGLCSEVMPKFLPLTVPKPSLKNWKHCCQTLTIGVKYLAWQGLVLLVKRLLIY